MHLQSLHEYDKEYIFKNIEKVLSAKYIEKIWEMIWKRWQHYETICNKNDIYGKNKILAVLTYDKNNNTYTIDVPGENTEKEVPFMISLFVRRG